jgi:nicotinamidase/pyrazinamidase
MDSDNSALLRLKQGDALIIVDVQNDFLTGGSLEVPQGNEIIPVFNQYIKVFATKGLPVFATRDWHPQNHCSFEAQGGLWPPHCVVDSPGAQFAPDLILPTSVVIISSATEPDKEAYSGFEGTDLDERLRSAQIQRLFIGGLATDYCVLSTVKDALDGAYKVFLLQDAIRAVNINPDDGKKAEEVMTRIGAIPISFKMFDKANR